jgi:acyl phosphate:glycerol-3-phosphate acyltransferase
MLLILVVAYLIGSLPVAYIVGRLNGIDIFKVGSGNMGANNVSRALGLKWGAITWFLDSIKGIVAILVARQLVTPEHYAIATMIGAIGAIIGHNWSIFVMFITGRLRGGKGAATAIGTWFLFIPLQLIAVVMGIWVLIVITTRYVSLAVLVTTALIALLIVTLVASGQYDPIYISYLVVSLIIFYRHRDNIVALLAGKERRLGQKA